MDWHSHVVAVLFDIQQCNLCRGFECARIPNRQPLEPEHVVKKGRRSKSQLTIDVMTLFPFYLIGEIRLKCQLQCQLGPFFLS